MTDRILSDDEVNSLESFAMRWSNNPRELAGPCVRLCTSHRLLTARVQELERQVEALDREILGMYEPPTGGRERSLKRLGLSSS